MSAPVPITVRVNVAAGYDVVVGEGVLESIGERVRAVLPAARRVLVVYDAHAPLPSTAVCDALADADLDVCWALVTPEESEKTLVAADDCLQQLAQARCERTDAVIALGGGIVGDVAGFVAATYRRGIAWVQCPTTLLSMVDASVGGKTGVNLQVGDELQKNMVGAFHQPSLVLADVSTLSTLPARDFASGCAEIIKHAMIARSVPTPDASLSLDILRSTLPDVRHDSLALARLVAQNVALKAGVVECDERELKHDGGRALLNLGHTFGHAMETIASARADGSTTDGLTHGEAVALGLLAASRTSAALRLVDDAFVATVRTTLQAANLPTRVQGLPAPDAMIDRMHADKKSIAGSLRVILPTGPGTATVVKDPPREALEAGWREIGCEP
ncbi:MAG TPA: 3-dehydroquinate synthase family protein [Phycisphaerales bacterium]|nr:3-dehydroquinate synthase family protein [Phycisphaerales bacterium]